MGVRIESVEAGSPAEKYGILPGDLVLSLGGHPIADVLDYRFFMSESSLAVRLEREGESLEIRVRKGRYDDLGLGFATYLMDEQRRCKNNCVFCFIDQLPPGMRETLYFKDDDSRLGFLFGNYITLTNLEPADADRMIAMKISPVNISVHTTNPELRVKMMRNPRAGESLRLLPRLAEAGIKINAQLVLCPGLNDGAELTRSLGDLCALAPGLQSVAVVPVGLTKHRNNLPELRLFTPREAREVIAETERFAAINLERFGTRICHAADEWYLCAGIELPPFEDYEDFDQLENGVGMLALLKQEFTDALENRPARFVGRRVTIATGVAAAPVIRELASGAMRKFPGLSVEIISIANRFFGETITVAGLLTGRDLLEQLRDVQIGDELLLPASTLRHERDLFLDDMSLEELSAALGCPVRPVESDGGDLLAAMLGEKIQA